MYESVQALIYITMHHPNQPINLVGSLDAPKPLHHFPEYKRYEPLIAPDLSSDYHHPSLPVNLVGRYDTPKVKFNFPGYKSY